MTKYCAYAVIPRSILSEVFSSSVYLPATKGLFEGLEVNLPGNTDSYLQNLYHNYMELPPEEKRERHFFSQFYIPKQYYEQDNE